MLVILIPLEKEYPVLVAGKHVLELVLGMLRCPQKLIPILLLMLSNKKSTPMDQSKQVSLFTQTSWLTKVVFTSKLVVLLKVDMLLRLLVGVLILLLR